MFFSGIRRRAGFYANILTLLFSMAFLYPIGIRAQSTGEIRGQVIDADTKSPLPMATVRIADTKSGAIADSSGKYTLKNLPEGKYSLTFEYIGYLDAVRKDIEVRAGKATAVNAELKSVGFNDSDMVVTNDYFMPHEDQPVSVMNLSAEEIREAPGTGNDINRVLSSHPSVAKIDDEKNSLSVRGGSPLENTYFINNIEIPNLNHFPVQGSSGGLFSMIDAQLMNRVDFYSGGFSSKYGGRMSSVIDISMRDANRMEFNGLLDLSLGLSGILAEGPISHDKGGWLLSARRSSINYAMEIVNEDLKVPEFRDLLFMADYDLSPSDKLTLMNLYAYNFWDTNNEEAILEASNWFRDADINRNIFGISWRHLWKDKGYSETSVWHNYMKFDQTLWLIDYGEIFQDIKSDEQTLGLRNLNYLKFNDMHKLEFGADVRYDYNLYNNFYDGYYDEYGRGIPPSDINSMVKALGYGLFASHIFRPGEKFSMTYGLRVDHNTINNFTHVSPRFSISWNPLKHTSFSFATGVYYQNLPLLLISQNPHNKDLDDPFAYHFIVGMSQLLSPTMLLTLEVYDKEYHNCPMDHSMSYLFIMDQTVLEEIFMNNANLVSGARARSYGIEMLLHKKRSGLLYWQLGAAYFRSHYRASTGRWFDRVYDNRYLANIEIGCHPNDKWNISVRWVLAGGAPYSKYSYVMGKPFPVILAINNSRFPVYKTTSIRIDRRLTIGGIDWTLYFSTYNVFNNQECQTLFRSLYYNNSGFMKQWPRIVLLGVQVEY